MASKKAKRAPKAQIQDLTVSERPALPAHKPSGKSLQATLLTLVGFAATLMGLALTLAPNLSWKASKIMVGFDYLGVHGGALVMGGLSLVGIAMVLRRVNQVSAIASQSGEDTGLLESVAADVLQVGSVLEGLESNLESSVRELKGELDGLRQTVSNVASEAQQAPEGLGSEDALFRLAASLDKVGAKIEERLKLQFSDLTERIDRVETSLAANTELLEEQATQPAPAPMPAPAYPTPALHQTQHHPVPAVHEPHHQPDPALHQTQHQPAPMLHQTQHHPAQMPPVAPAPQPEDPGSLGVLDHLDDDGVASPLPGQEPPVNFDQASQLSLQVPPPAAGRWDAQPGPAPVQETGEPPLMADPEIRSALEDLGRQG